MKWVEFKVHTTELGSDLLSAVFYSCGINGIRIDLDNESANEHLLETKASWDYANGELTENSTPSITAYIACTDENADLVEKITNKIHSFAKENPDFDLGSLEITTKVVDEDDWKDSWKQHYKPFEVGEKLIVSPSWEEAPVTDDRLIIKLDPGMAFGSGTHETTKMSLEMLEANIKIGDNVLDLGCGSGILSIAAKMLGAETATAVDFDLVCVKATAENAIRNDVEINVVLGDVLDDEKLSKSIMPKNGDGFDIVLANIVADVLINIAPKVRDIISHHGFFISSGIINDRLFDVLNAYSDAGFNVLEVTRMGEWCAVLATQQQLICDA